MSADLVLGIADSITSGAALVRDGRIVAAVSEERLNRIKMAMGWPRLSIREVLRIAGVEPDEISRIAIATKSLYWRPEAETTAGFFDADWGTDKRLVLALGNAGSRVLGGLRAARAPYYALKRLFGLRRSRAIRRELQAQGFEAKPVYVDHHLAHAASAYYTGGHADANVVTLDGAGDGLSAAVYRGRDGVLERHAAVSSYDSIGNFYSYVTHILGFKAHRHEGKITGLAAYGEPRYGDLFRSLVRYRDGRIENRARAFHVAALKKVRKLLPAEAAREDVAASIQLVLEEVCAAFVAHWVDKLGSRHLALAGGVAANVKLNQRLFAIDGVPTVSVHPAMGDDGLAAGAALHALAASRPRGERAALVHDLPHAYLGSRYGNDELRRALDSAGVSYDQPADLAARIARFIADKKVVARFAGAMEYGPRALGNRSILVHAGDPTVNDWLNQRLQRTEFMPFAPVTLDDETSDCYVGLDGAERVGRFMTITCDCTDRLRGSCPAVVHVDGTARPQLLGRDENPGYRAILEEYRKLTGFSTIINTAFHMHEEPIVCTPDDALRAFTLGHLDSLVFGDYLV
ncbi:MAG: carbamoyltransferase, partial [Planctomycetota bacterium]|nr:carbamoyltransferase [Planctomycetota bacterium]